MMHMFNLLAEAYLPNQAALLAAYSNATAGGNRAAARQLLDFFEFFLPLVHSLHPLSLPPHKLDPLQVRDYGTCL
jgi:hypothetical protein